VKDTFYNTTAISWALDNSTSRLCGCCWKESDSAGDVLMTGVQEGRRNRGLALTQGGVKPATLTAALVAATGDSKNDEIAAMLKKAGAVPPPKSIPPHCNHMLVNTRGNPGPRFPSASRPQVDCGCLGQRPFTLMAIYTTTFRPAAFERDYHYVHSRGR